MSSNHHHRSRGRRITPEQQGSSCKPWQPPQIASGSRGLQTLAAELQAKHEEAAARGYAEGLEKAKAEMQQEMARQRAAFERVMDLLCQPLANVDPEVEHALAKLALEIGNQLYQAEMERQPEHIANIVGAALGIICEHESNLVLHLNSNDYQLLHDALPHLWEDGRIVPTADPEMAPGGCRVSGSFSAVDATCETRLQAVRETVISGLPHIDQSQQEEPADAPGRETEPT